MSSILLKRIVIFALLLTPAASFASVDITEIMYDAPGSDSGREWVEIANTGTTTVDIWGYKLFEGGVHHGISVVAGTSTLTAGEVAVVANDPQKFLEDFPNFSGTLFKSSFSLSNTGETFVIKDSKLLAISAVTYRSVMGAAGDGNSLHKNAEAWTPGAPNPGSLVATAAIKPPPVATTLAVTTAKSTPVQSTTSKSMPKSKSSTASTEVPFQMPALPQNDTLWATVLGLVALMVVGVGGALYVRGSKATLTSEETVPTADEFKIE